MCARCTCGVPLFGMNKNGSKIRENTTEVKRPNFDASPHWNDIFCEIMHCGHVACFYGHPPCTKNSQKLEKGPTLFCAEETLNSPGCERVCTVHPKSSALPPRIRKWPSHETSNDSYCRGRESFASLNEKECCLHISSQTNIAKLCIIVSRFHA